MGVSTWHAGMLPLALHPGEPMDLCSPKLHVDLWRGREAKSRLKALFLPPLLLLKMIPRLRDGGDTLQPFVAAVAVWCKSCKAYRAG